MKKKHFTFLSRIHLRTNYTTRSTEQCFFVADCKLTTHLCLWVQIKQTRIIVIVVIVVVVVVVVVVDGNVYDRLWLQIKQTSIGVVHANCFRFLA